MFVKKLIGEALKGKGSSDDDVVILGKHDSTEYSYVLGSVSLIGRIRRVCISSKCY